MVSEAVWPLSVSASSGHPFDTLQSVGTCLPLWDTPKIPNCLLFSHFSHFHHLQILEDFFRDTLQGWHLGETSLPNSSSPTSKWVFLDIQTLDFFCLSTPCCHLDLYLRPSASYWSISSVSGSLTSLVS